MFVCVFNCFFHFQFLTCMYMWSEYMCVFLNESGFKCEYMHMWRTEVNAGNHSLLLFHLTC